MSQALSQSLKSNDITEEDYQKLVAAYGKKPPKAKGGYYHIEIPKAMVIQAGDWTGDWINLSGTHVQATDSTTITVSNPYGGAGWTSGSIKAGDMIVASNDWTFYDQQRAGFVFVERMMDDDYTQPLEAVSVKLD